MRTNINERVGFMQGRFSPMVGSRIQAFPWDDWREEFVLAQQHDFHLMEWTLDHDRLYDNPLMTVFGQAEINALVQRHQLRIPSLTGDCFMQAPFWKVHDTSAREKLQEDFCAIVRACHAINIRVIVLPLVDNGRLDNMTQENCLVAFLQDQTALLNQYHMRIAFESDFEPIELQRFIKRFDADLCGVNYDIGNSAALGFDPKEEIMAYGERIINVHVKDRILSGTTVPLGEGNADFDTVFSTLASIEYRGHYVLQTARSMEHNHAGVLCRYYGNVMDWLNTYDA